LAQKYELKRSLAKGGMGEVWVAHHLELQVPVAIKFIEGADERPKMRMRFQREARAAAKLRSPHVVQVLDYGVDDGTPYLVMEMLEGEDLRHRLARRTNLSLGETVVLVRQIAKGLALAHQEGIVHRDIKPGNIFIAKVGTEEVVKVLDFGVAKLRELGEVGEQTSQDQLLGSPAFMSPEQARGAEVEPRSDVWSLGVLTYVALTGSRPFQGSNVGDLLVRICTEPLTPATTVRPELPAGIDAFFARALCRSPDGRFDSVLSLADALGSLASGEQEKAAPVSAEGPVASEGPARETFEESGVETIDAPVVTQVRSKPERTARGRWYAIAGLALLAGGSIATLSLGDDLTDEEAHGVAAHGPATAAPPAVETPAVEEPAPTTVGVEAAESPAVSAAIPAVPSPSVFRKAPASAPTSRGRVAKPAPQPDAVPKAQSNIDPKFGLPKK